MAEKQGKYNKLGSGSAPFWQAGLRHGCRRCAACCSREGFVYFSRLDIERAAQLLELEFKDFVRLYLTTEQGSFFLEVDDGRQCPFLQESGCIIQQAKPLQCAAYPFWPENLESEQTWEEVMRECPGAGKGRLVSPITIDKWLKKQKVQQS